VLDGIFIRQSFEYFRESDGRVVQIMKQLIQNLLGKFGYAIRRTSTLRGHNPGSTTRPIAQMPLFLEDIKARKFIPKGIIDVGANSGEWTQMALSVFPNTPVIMIEPQDEMEPFLNEVIKRIPNTYFIKAGAGREPGELVQTIWEDHAGSSFLPTVNPESLKAGKQRRTKIITIDDALAASFPQFVPELVKLDIQGFELEALSGAKTLFGKTEMFILEAALFSAMPNQPLVREIISFMFERGYELYDVPGHYRRPSDGALSQLDLAFVKASGMFRDLANLC
jgi:FkbM family methyltransferase